MGQKVITHFFFCLMAHGTKIGTVCNYYAWPITDVRKRYDNMVLKLGWSTRGASPTFLSQRVHLKLSKWPMYDTPAATSDTNFLNLCFNS
jgi:hypothetical protein